MARYFAASEGRRVNDEQDGQRSDRDTDLENEIRRARRFTPEEAMARMAGPGAMKGASPVSRVQQAETEIGTCLRADLADPDGTLRMLIQRDLKGSDLLLRNLDRPQVALARYCERILASDELLRELVRQADVEWGRRMDERPHFDRQDSAPHPDDPFTVESVRAALLSVLQHLPQ